MVSPASVLTFFELFLSHYILGTAIITIVLYKFHACREVTAYTMFLKHVKKKKPFSISFSIYSQLSLDIIRLD